MVRVGRRDAGVPGGGDGADEAADGDGADNGLDVDVAGVGCLRPDETSPARDFSSSVPDQGGLEVAPPVDSGVLPVLGKGGLPCGAGGVCDVGRSIIGGSYVML